MTNVCERWALDHTNALQGAWFNGVGFETWENGAPIPSIPLRFVPCPDRWCCPDVWVVWGTWNGITERDGAQAKRLRPLMRFLGGRGYLQSQGWLPHSGTTHPALFASYWPLTEGGKTTSAAWTVVSRGKAQSAHGYPKPALTNVPPPP